MTPEPGGSGVRILYVTDAFPFPLTSGYLRHFHFIRLLARTHSITLLSLVGGDFISAHADAMRGFTSHIETFPSAQRSRSRHRKAMSRLRTGLDPRGGDGPVLRLARSARRLHDQAPFDLVLLAGKRVAPVLWALPAVPVIADLCDAASVRLRDQARYATWLRRGFVWLESRQVAAIERRVLDRAEHVVFASARDRDALDPNARRICTIVPNGVDVGYWSRTEPVLGLDTIVFTGAMSYAPNEDAALRLVRLLRRIRRDFPSATLLIVGRAPTARLVRAGAAPGVTVTGEVPDVRPFLERATVFAAPLRFGAGIQNKVLEALAMQVPVVASTGVALGLETATGEAAPLQQADSDDDCVAAIVAALRAGRSRPAPHAEGREFVHRWFSWEAAGESLSRMCAATGTASRALPRRALG